MNFRYFLPFENAVCTKEEYKLFPLILPDSADSFQQTPLGVEARRKYVESMG